MSYTMISFEHFIIEDGSPIYMQIIRHIKQGIVAGTIQNHDELPSRRVLSALLGVNPNTVQKAYRLLEDDTIIESHTGAKSYVVLDHAQVERIRVQLLESNAYAVVNAMKQMGIAKEDALALVERLWD